MKQKVGHLSVTDDWDQKMQMSDNIHTLLGLQNEKRKGKKKYTIWDKTHIQTVPAVSYLNQNETTHPLTSTDITSSLMIVNALELQLQESQRVGVVIAWNWKGARSFPSTAFSFGKVPQGFFLQRIPIPYRSCQHFKTFGIANF